MNNQFDIFLGVEFLYLREKCRLLHAAAICDRMKKSKMIIRERMKMMRKKLKVAFICVHNSCRSQIAEALGKKFLSDKFECYSAGTETKPSINQDAVRLMKEFC